jgi:two-component system sensor histidine kinase/response regulator
MKDSVEKEAGTSLDSDEELKTLKPWLDISEGLYRALGRRSLYVRLLRGYAAKQRTLPATIRTLLGEGQVHEAMREAHMATSMAGQIGADAAQDAAKAVEIAIRGESPEKPVEEALMRMETVLAPLIVAIELVFPEPEVPSPPS